MRSRWDTSARKDENGDIIPVIFNEGDFEAVRLVCPVQGVREPWSYQYLPGTYFAPLLRRGPSYYTNRLQQLACSPHNYLAHADQPQSNYRSIIYSIGENGYDELRSAGHTVPRRELRRVPHELLASIVAASFEYGAMKHELTIETVEDVRRKFHADWPVFKLTNSHHSKRVYIEADTGSEQFKWHPDSISIEEKIDNYLTIEDLHRCVVVFATAKYSRVDAFVEAVKRGIDKKKLPHSLARSFLATHVEFDRFLTKYPKLSDWAVSADYQRAVGPFNFLKDEK